MHGRNGAIYVGGPAGTGTKLTAKTEWTLQRNRDYVDATSFGDTNKTYLAGLPNVQGTFAGFLDVNGDELLAAATGEIYQVYLYAADGTNGSPTVLVGNGPAFLDASVTSSVNDAVKITGEFRASGGWTISGVAI